MDVPVIMFDKDENYVVLTLEEVSFCFSYFCIGILN